MICVSIVSENIREIQFCVLMWNKKPESLGLSESGRSGLGLIVIHNPVCLVQLLTKLLLIKFCLQKDAWSKSNLQDHIQNFNKPTDWVREQMTSYCCFLEQFGQE